MLRSFEYWLNREERYEYEREEEYLREQDESLRIR